MDNFVTAINNFYVEDKDEYLRQLIDGDITKNEISENTAFEKDIIDKLNHGANPLVKGAYGETLGHLSARLSLMNLTEELFERAIQPQGDENGMFPWHYAAFFGCLMTLKCYKEKGFDISSQTNSYWDILLIAASQNQSEIIEWILQENIVSVDDTSDAFNRTALFLAIQYKRREAAFTLLKYAADATLPTKIKMTCLGLSSLFMPDITIRLLDE